MSECWIWTFNRPCPKPCNDFELLSDERFEIGTFLGHLRCDFYRRVKMAHKLLRFLAHPRTIVAHVLRQTGGTGPFSFKSQFLLLRAMYAVPETDRASAGKLGRNLDHGLVYEHGHRVEITGVNFQSQ